MRIRTPRGRLAIAVVGVVLAAGVALATVAVVSDASATGDADVTAVDGGSVAVGQARLELPPGSVAGDAQLTASIGGPPAVVATSVEGSVPRVAIASEPVTFDLVGAAASGPATVTFSIAPDMLPRSAAVDGGAWLARVAPGTDRWTPVGGRYDPASGTVTAQGEPSGSWAVWTWDWQGIEGRLREQFAAFGTGRAAREPCPDVDGVRVEAPGRDPVLLGCARAGGPDAISVGVTGNRGYSMVLQVPDGADPGPPAYAGFEEYVRTRQRVVDALGGVYLAPTATLPFTADAHGAPLEFRAAPSLKTHVLDVAVPVATAVFDGVTLGYADCVLDLVARSRPAALREAPALVLQCFPLLAKSNEATRFYVERMGPLTGYLRTTLALLDEGRDRLTGEWGLVRVTRPSLPPPSLYVSSGYERGALYSPDALPSKIGINNHEYVDELRWSEPTPSGATATGVLNELNCVPSCADGTYRVYDVELVASAPESCAVDVYADGSDAVRTVQTYAYTTITIRKTLPEPSPNPINLGDSVIVGACR